MTDCIHGAADDRGNHSVTNNTMSDRSGKTNRKIEFDEAPVPDSDRTDAKRTKR
jgi:hypothetical protein